MKSPYSALPALGAALRGGASLSGDEGIEDRSDESEGNKSLRLSSSSTMFSEYRILRAPEFRRGLVTLIVSSTGSGAGLGAVAGPGAGLASGLRRTVSFSFGFLAGASSGVGGGPIEVSTPAGSTWGAGVTTGPGTGVLLLGRRPDPLLMPRSVAILYFLIFALDIRLVK